MRASADRAKADTDRARISAAPCHASRTCVWCAGRAAIPTTCRCPDRPMRCSCASPHAHARILRDRHRRAALALPGVVAVLTGRDYVDDGFAGMPHFPNPADAVDITRAVVPADAGAQDSRRAATAVRGRARALRRRGRRHGGGREHRGGARRRRGGRGRVRGSAGRDRCVRSAGARSTRDMGRGAPDNVGARQCIRRPRRGGSRARRRPPGGRADHRQSAYRQRLHGAALRRSASYNPADGQIHADLGLPGRAPHPPSARGLPQGAAGAACTWSAPMSAADSDRAPISIPSRWRWCGRRGASAGR